jgi:hypothetical protein
MSTLSIIIVVILGLFCATILADIFINTNRK